MAYQVKNMSYSLMVLCFEVGNGVDILFRFSLSLSLSFSIYMNSFSVTVIAPAMIIDHNCRFINELLLTFVANA